MLDTMRPTRLALMSAGVLLAAALAAPAGDCCQPALTLESLQRMSGEQLMALFTAAEMGRPMDGTLKGRLVHLTDRNLPRIKCRIANALWRGKAARASDGYFINRWIGGARWIDSQYVIGPSWVDGKPAVIMEYA